MKKHIYIFALLIVVFTAVAQTPTYFNTNTATGANSFPLNNSATSRKVQWFIPPNSLGSVTAGNNITDVYFHAGSTASRTYPNLTVKLKTGSGTGLTGAAAGPVEAGMVVVYAGVNVTIASTLGNWFKITLQTPWLYDPTLPLIVELEHDATTGTGPTLYQGANIPGPGNGRQWADYNAANISGVGTNQINFGIDVIPATPCTAAPFANSTLPATFSTCPGMMNPNLTIATTYSFGGITYAWQSSTLSAVGPYSTIPGATMNIAPTGSIAVTTWYQAVATCTNPGGGSTTLTPSQYYIPPGNVVNTVPYIEGFEGLQIDDRLPNCSWYAANLGNTVTSYTAAASNNRVPRTGNKFASFGLPSTDNIVYTNGITMSPGITYSASLWYATEYLGANNWTDLTILVGSSQSTTGLVQIATVPNPVSGSYKQLAGLFTVPTAGDYYIAIKANSTGGSALYLSWDDLSVTIPCNHASGVNTPTLNITSNTPTICTGQQLILNASGADTYTWNTGATGMVLNESPLNPGLTNYQVMGTNLLTGCTAILNQSILVNQSPLVLISAQPATVCAGQPLALSALGNAVSYLWSNGGTNPIITVTTNVPNTYTVIGIGANGCPSTDTKAVSVFVLPTVGATSSNLNTACANDLITLTGTGALTYHWISNTSGGVLQGSSINVTLNAPTVFTVTGTDNNGCFATNTLAQNIEACVGLQEQSKTLSNVRVYPSPANEVLVLELNTSALRTIELIDLTGRIVLSNTNSAKKISLNISELSSGIYYVKVTSNNEVEVVKIVKE